MKRQLTLLKEIRQAIDDVRVLAEHDNEGAHCAEDKLFIRILELIADGELKTKVEMQKAAALGVELSKLEYRRWYV